MQTATMTTDLEVLEDLNAGYIDSVQRSDVQWFERNLAEDFLSSNFECNLVDRAGFLERIAKPAGVTGLRAEDVRIRVFGDIAIIHAGTRYTKPDGREGAGRYTDVWAKRKGRWLCIAAQAARG